MDDPPNSETKVRFFTIPEGHRAPSGTLWLLAAYAFLYVFWTLVVPRFGVSGFSLFGAVLALAPLAPLSLLAYFAVCTCSVNSTAIVFRPDGVFTRGDRTPLAEVVAARVLPGPLVELELRSGVKRIGPWKTFTTIKFLDRRDAKCRTLADAINAAALTQTQGPNGRAN